MKSNKICNFEKLTRTQLTDKELGLKKTLQVSDYFATDIPYSPKPNKELVCDFFKSVTGIVTTCKKNIPQIPLTVPPARGAIPHLSESGMPSWTPGSIKMCCTRTIAKSSSTLYT
jgi:hypothetical protein